VTRDLVGLLPEHQAWHQPPGKHGSALTTPAMGTMEEKQLALWWAIFERAEWKICATGRAANEARAWRFMLYGGLFE
jgi:hypothetical protein